MKGTYTNTNHMWKTIQKEIIIIKKQKHMSKTKNTKIKEKEKEKNMFKLLLLRIKKKKKTLEKQQNNKNKYVQTALAQNQKTTKRKHWKKTPKNKQKNIKIIKLKNV